MKTLGFCVAKVMRFVFILYQVLNPQPFFILEISDMFLECEKPEPFHQSGYYAWSIKSTPGTITGKLGSRSLYEK